MASLEDYQLGQVIAKGSFGADIRHGRYFKDDKNDKDDKNRTANHNPNNPLHVSIKCVSKRALIEHRPPSRARLYGLAVVQEQRLLKRFGGNQCVPKLYACFHNPDFVVTVTQCCTGGSLQQVIASMSTSSTTTTTCSTTNRFWREHCAVQLLDILVFLHTSSIVHCDLSPSVLHLTADGNLRLVDFGYAVDLKHHPAAAMHPRPQTPYSAPELWHDVDDNAAATAAVVTTAVDLWSAGCICFALHATHSPFAVTVAAAGRNSSPSVLVAPPKYKEEEDHEDSKKPAVADSCIAASSSNAAMQAQADDDEDVVDVTAVGQRIASYAKEYRETTKKHPQVLLDQSFHCYGSGGGSSSSSSNESSSTSSSLIWREIIYELLHPDPVQRTQAAACDTTGDLYDAIRSRFLLLHHSPPSTSTASTDAVAGTTTFRPPVPRWLLQDNAAAAGGGSSSCSSSSGDFSNSTADDDTHKKSSDE